MAMINLLPPDSARQLRAARHNSILIRYVIGAAIALALITLVYLVAFALFKTTENTNTELSQQNQQKISGYGAEANAAKEYRDNLQRAKTILDSEVSYPTALARIATSLPEETVISSLALTPDTIGQPLTLTVEAKTQEAALAVKKKFEENKIATNISISSLTHTAASTEPASSGTASEYPFSINLNLTLLETIFTVEEKSNE